MNGTHKFSLRNSPFSVVFRCIRANRKVQILIPLCLTTIGISSYYNSRAVDAFSTTHELYREKEFQTGFDSFKNSIAILAVHYFFSQLSEIISKLCSITIFRAFLSESVNKYTQLDYSEFHAKGSGRIQDNISRSSRAAREVSICLAFEIPKSLIDFSFAFHNIYNLMNPSHFRIFIALFYISISVAFCTAFYSYKNDKINLHLYKKSFVPLTDLLHNFDVMKAFNKEKEETENYDDALKPFVSRWQIYQLKLAVLLLFQKAIVFLPHIYVFYSTANNEALWRKGRDPKLKDFLDYNSYFGTLKKSMMILRNHIFSCIREMAEMKTDLDFLPLDEPKEVGLVVKNSFDSRIKLEDTDLYAGNNLIQKKQNFTINKGERVAITGVNGAGKSVFIKTMLKFFKNEGKMYIDDVLIENISARSLRRLIAYVPQDPHIFNSTVLYNLGYSQKNIDETKIYDCCQEFGLHEFFKSMKDGYYTMSGERGKYLSGGQKQRISFMRAIIKDAPIILMDEPTANVDRASEVDLINKVLTLRGERTFILIVHNHDLLKDFDKILYFSKDEITTFNSYDEFINRS